MERERGFTLIEIIFALFVGLILMGAAYVAMISGQQTSAGVERKVAAQQDIRAALQAMSLEIGMASYNPNVFGGFWHDLPVLGSATNVSCTGSGDQTYKGIRVATPTTLVLEMDNNENKQAGDVAGEIGRIEARCRAVIAIDSPFGLTPEVMQQGLQIPCAILYGSFGSGLYNKLTKDAILVQLGSTDHNLFCDQYWLYQHTSLTTGREINRTMHAYSLWFLNKYFKGINDPTPSPKDYPLVSNVKQK